MNSVSSLMLTFNENGICASHSHNKASAIIKHFGRTLSGALKDGGSAQSYAVQSLGIDAFTMGGMEEERK